MINNKSFTTFALVMYFTHKFSNGIKLVHLQQASNVCCCGIGFSTPPMGENMFIASGIADQSLEAISAKALPFVAVNLSAIGLMVAFPQIVLWLPNLLSAVE